MEMGFIPLAFLLFVGCSALPDGAPRLACSSMTPHHSGISVQRSHSPYTVTAAKIGDKVRVTISSSNGEEFEGFMLQARSKTDEERLVEGKFSRDSQVYKTIDCFNGKQNTLTHINIDKKEKVVTEWTPSNGVNEEIIFRATVVKNYIFFWTEIDSASVRIQSGGQLGVNDSSFNVEGTVDYLDLKYDGCGITKGCFGYPAGCSEIGDCEVLLSFSKVSNGIMFKLDGFLSSGNYMAMALSTDAIMGDDSVTDCYRQGSNVYLHTSYNDGKSNTRRSNISHSHYKTSFSDGFSSCSWISPFLESSNGHSYNLENNAYHVLLAKGYTHNGNLRYHHNLKIASEDPIRFTYRTQMEGADMSDAIRICGIPVLIVMTHLLTIKYIGSVAPLDFLIR